MSDLGISDWLVCNVQLVLSGMECPLDFKFLFLASPYIVLCSLHCFPHTSDLSTHPLQVYVKTFNAELKLFWGDLLPAHWHLPTNVLRGLSEGEPREVAVGARIS